MAMDVNAIRARLQQLNEKGGGKKVYDTLKPADGMNVRLLPLPNSDDPIVERQFHYLNHPSDNRKNVTIACGAQFDQECPICEFANQMAAFDNPDGTKKSAEQKKSDWEIFRKLQAVKKYYVAVIARVNKTDESPKDAPDYDGPKWWMISEAVLKGILGEAMDEDLNTDRDDGGGMECLLSVKNGHDLKITVNAAGQNGNTTDFKQTKVKARAKATKLHNDSTISAKILTSIKPIDEVVKPTTAVELQKAFDNFLAYNQEPKAGDENDEKEPETRGPAKEPEQKVESKNAEKLKGKKTLDEMFDKMAGDKDAADAAKA
jgi:hypothetical protein